MYRSFAEIADRWRQYGATRAVLPWAWGPECVLATLGPQADDSDTARDFSGDPENEGTLTNGPTWGYGTYRGGAFRQVGFDGTDDYIGNFDDGSKFAFIQNTGVFTLSAWCFWDGSDWGAIVGNTPTRTADKGFRLSIVATTGVIRTSATRGVSGQLVWDFDATTIDASLHHIAAVGNGATVSVYIDGAFSASGAIGTLSSGNATRAANIGRLGEGETAFPLYWPGQLADARIYSRALSPAEIRQFEHPLSAYQIRPLPTAFAYSAVALGSPWLWQQSSIIGGGTI